MNIKLLTTKADIDAAITSINNRGKKLDADIQLCALSVVAHVGKHGDVTVANRLYTCMPNGSRRRALAEYLMAFGKLSANADRATAKESPFVYDKTKTYNDEVLKAASETMWYDFAPEPPVLEMFDLRGALHRILAQAAKVGKVNDEALLSELRKLEAIAQTEPSI